MVINKFGERKREGVHLFAPVHYDSSAHNPSRSSYFAQTLSSLMMMMTLSPKRGERNKITVVGPRSCCSKTLPCKNIRPSPRQAPHSLTHSERERERGSATQSIKPYEPSLYCRQAFFHPQTRRLQKIKRERAEFSYRREGGMAATISSPYKTLLS